MLFTKDIMQQFYSIENSNQHPKMTATRSWLLTGVSAILASTVFTMPQSASAQQRLMQDPATGNVYRETTRTQYQPVVNETMQSHQQTRWQPQTTTETRPELQRNWYPVTQYKWMPYVEGRWNPFVQPRIAYRHVAETHWQSRDQVIDRTTTQTRWVPKTETVQVPHREVTYQAVPKTDYQLVQRGTPAASNLPPSVASRLRPIDQGSSRIASVPVSNPLAGGRSEMQSGMPAERLLPSPTLVPTTTIAAPSMPLRR